MSSHVFRFLGKPCDGAPGHWRLDDVDAHHALKVLRLAAGQPVEVTDGKGSVAIGKLLPTGKESADVEVVSSHKINRPHPILHLAVGALKPGDLDDTLPALVELGMQRISIFLAEQSGKFRLAEKSIERWERIMEGAVKQSKQAWLPELGIHSSLSDFLEQGLVSAELNKNNCVYWVFAAPGDETIAADQSNKNQSTVTVPDLMTAFNTAGKLTKPDQLLALVGSEKGFSDQEVRLALANGFKAISLPGSVLRAKTAAVSAATMLAMAAYRSR